jgi:hypothetical protein
VKRSAWSCEQSQIEFWQRARLETSLSGYELSGFLEKGLRLLTSLNQNFQCMCVHFQAEPGSNSVNIVHHKENVCQWMSRNGDDSIYLKKTFPLVSLHGFNDRQNSAAKCADQLTSSQQVAHSRQSSTRFVRPCCDGELGNVYDSLSARSFKILHVFSCIRPSCGLLLLWELGMVTARHDGTNDRFNCIRT